jgi:hypothetical protein
MKWEISLNKEEGCVYLNTSGTLTIDDNTQMVAGALSFARKHNMHVFLVDYSKTATNLSLLEVDKLPDMLEQKGLTAQDRVAIILNRETTKPNNVSHFRNLSYIRNLSIAFFPDINEAKEWLKSDLHDENESSKT